MRHLAFFEAIAEHPDQGDPLWVESVSGMLVLRFFEEWLDSPALASVNEPGIARMQGLIEEIQNPEIRYLLGTAVRVLMEAEGGDPTLVVGPLLAYALVLEESAQHTLATDVLETIAEPLERDKGPHGLQLAAATYIKVGKLFLRLERFDEAEDRFRRTISCAERINDLSLALEGCISQTRVWIARGNIGDVEVAIATVIDRALGANLTRIEALARRVRGTTLLMRQRYDEALRELYRAYPNAPDELEREYLLTDMATCTGALGLRNTARTLHQTLAHTAYNPMARSIARVNLLELAVLDGDQEAFQLLWNELKNERLPNDIGMDAHLYHAQGIERWGTRTEAISAYLEVVEIAAKGGVHRVEFLALEAAERLQRETADDQLYTPLSSYQEPAASTWQDVTQALEAICSLRLHTMTSAD